jgi:hypothetical protein
VTLSCWDYAGFENIIERSAKVVITYLYKILDNLRTNIKRPPIRKNNQNFLPETDNFSFFPNLIYRPTIINSAGVIRSL